MGRGEGGGGQRTGDVGRVTDSSMAVYRAAPIEPCCCHVRPPVGHVRRRVTPPIAATVTTAAAAAATVTVTGSTGLTPDRTGQDGQCRLNADHGSRTSSGNSSRFSTTQRSAGDVSFRARQRPSVSFSRHHRLDNTIDIATSR